MQPRIHAADEGRQLEVLGNPMLEKATGRDFHGNAAVFVMTLEPGGGPPSHLHEGADEFFYLLEGQLDVWVGDTHSRMVPGMSVTLPRGIPHRFDNLSSRAAKVLIVVTPAKGAAFFDDLDRERPELPGEEAKVAATLARHNIRLFAPRPQPRHGAATTEGAASWERSQAI